MVRSEGSERTSISGAKLVKFTNVRKETKITGGELTILKTCNELSVLRSIANFFIGRFVFTSESLSFFNGIVSKFHFHVKSSN